MAAQTHIPDLEARSPWATINDKAEVLIHPPIGPVEGDIRLSGSKSLTNRALIIAALAEGVSTIDGILKSDDSYWCIDSLSRLGIRIEVEGDSATVTGCGGRWPVQSGELYVGAAGTAARFLPGALAISEGGKWTVKASKRMSERPIAPLLEALKQQGASITSLDTANAIPFLLEANGLRGGEAELPGSASSQFASGLSIAAPYAREPLTLQLRGEVVQKDYIDMTLDMMRAFGVQPQASADGQTIKFPVAAYKAQTIRLEPDVSACCYFWAIAALTEGRIRIDGIDAAATRQPDIEMLYMLEKMGCEVRIGEDYAEVRGPKQLKGGFTVSMKKWSDQTLTMAALAVFADAPIELRDAAHIRHHECDRIAAICAELRKLNIRVAEHEDGLTVYPGRPTAALLDTHDDHRMAMSLSLIGMKTDGIRLSNPGCVSKTCPDYFERLQALGVGIVYE